MIHSPEKDVIHTFIELTEKIANSRTNVLDFENGLPVFFRGEIHIIKMVGDFPCIYSSEIARKFGITRAVVHKTLLKLQQLDLIDREQDNTDKKRYRLFLTEKGQTAYQCHEAYHQKHDRALFDYVASLPASHLKSVKGFLKEAIDLIDNHT